MTTAQLNEEGGQAEARLTGKRPRLRVGQVSSPLDTDLFELRKLLHQLEGLVALRAELLQLEHPHMRGEVRKSDEGGNIAFLRRKDVP